MIIKSKDDTSGAMAALRKLLAMEHLSALQRAGASAELARLRAGAAAREKAAAHIEALLKDSEEWAVIHDLRLEHNGQRAQIDHLLIGRFFDIYVIESKYLTASLRVDAGGDFQVKTRSGWKPMDSPIDQNRRSIILLNQLIRDEKLTPTRLGLSIKPAFRNWILVPPVCRLSRGTLNEVIVLKLHKFERQLHALHAGAASAGDLHSVTKRCSPGTIMDFARRLARFHRPAPVDFAARFGILSATPFSAAPPPCEECASPLQPREAAAWQLTSRKPGQRILCRECQMSRRSGRRVLPPARRIAAKRGHGHMEHTRPRRVA